MLFMGTMGAINSPIFVVFCRKARPDPMVKQTFSSLFSFLYVVAKGAAPSRQYRKNL
jgi:hypothetical protein